MYGTWFTVVFGFVLAILFVVALAGTIASPIFAFLIFIPAFGAFLLFRGVRRSRAEGEAAGGAPDTSSESARPSGVRGAPSSGSRVTGGAPRSGGG